MITQTREGWEDVAWNRLLDKVERRNQVYLCSRTCGIEIEQQRASVGREFVLFRSILFQVPWIFGRFGSAFHSEYSILL